MPEAEPKNTDWFARMRQEVAQRAKKSLLTDRQRAEIAAAGWRELGYIVHIDEETNQIFGYPNQEDAPKEAVRQIPDIPEVVLAKLHRQHVPYRGQFAQMSFFKEVRHDTDAERREFLKRVGALTPAERKVRLRKVLAPWAWEVYDRLSITSLLLNNEMSNDVIAQMIEKLKQAEKIIKNPKIRAKDLARRGEFKYWLFLKRLHELENK